MQVGTDKMLEKFTLEIVVGGGVTAALYSFPLRSHLDEKYD